ncbi:unnamed protein product [Caretta caretta]
MESDWDAELLSAEEVHLYPSLEEGSTVADMDTGKSQSSRKHKSVNVTTFPVGLMRMMQHQKTLSWTTWEQPV